MRRLRFPLIALAALLPALQLQAELPPPNILWITAEDISPALGAYGDSVARTPHIDRLAASGQVFLHAYANAPICAPARSGLITGYHATSLGTQHLRSEVPIPDSLKSLPERLSKLGYYTTNNAKTDYNFDPAGRWHELGTTAHWKNRPKDRPFFSVFNYGLSHEGNGNKDGFDHDDLLDQRVDPAEINLPPYFPETPAFRALFARYYDLVTVFDLKVGQHLAELETAGLLENTVVFVFSDHGFGLPRYKRWLYRSGLQVPLVVRLPPAYQSHFNAKPGKRHDLVSFVDFAPTVLHLAGADSDDSLPGASILSADYEREFVFASRSRADDVYNVARALLDTRYLYVRNFTPHRPYMETARIFARESGVSYRELHRLREAGTLNAEAAAFFAPRPAEELYDLHSDPYELRNLADDPAHHDTLQRFRRQLKEHILQSRDIGLLHESEFMRRAAATGQTVYQYAQSQAYDLKAIFAAADSVGRSDVTRAQLVERLQAPDSGVRYWGAIALQQRPQDAAALIPQLRRALHDPSPAVALAAAETLVDLGQTGDALSLIAHYMRMSREPTTVLNAAMTARRIGSAAAPLLPVIHSEFDRYQGKVWGRYRDWSYAMFIGMAFDQTRINCGEALDLSRAK